MRSGEVNKNAIQYRAVRCLVWGAVFALAAGTAHADVFYLKSGGTVTGDLIETVGENYRIRASVGEIVLATSAVERIESTPSLFKEYDERAAATPDTAADQAALGAWCDERGLKQQARRHLQRAIELDPEQEVARRLLGYVRVNDVWIDGRPTTEPAGRERRKASEGRDEAEKEKDARDPARLLAELQGQWTRRIRAIQLTYLKVPNLKQIEEGRKRILAIRDSAAILPLARVLGQGDSISRALLVEALAQFPEDESTLNLAALGLMEPTPEIRRTVFAELARRDDPRVPAQYRKALREDRDSVVANAAEGLATLRVREAIPGLIEALRANRRKAVEVPVQSVYGSMSDAFARPTQVNFGGTNIIYIQPIIGVTSPASRVENVWQMREVTVFRTQVLEALKSLSGANFGFDQDDWQAWYEEHKE